MSKPSKTTNMATERATSQNQSVSILVSLRSVFDFALNQEQKENAEHQVQSHKSQQRKDAVARRYIGRRALRGTQQSIDQPGLAADFGGDPSGGVGDVGQGQHQHQQPQHV